MNLVFSRPARRGLRSMPEKDAAALVGKLEVFAADPFVPHPWAKAFGNGMGRVRHGDWRAIWTIDGDSVSVTVVRVGSRREIYR